MYIRFLCLRHLKEDPGILFPFLLFSFFPLFRVCLCVQGVGHAGARMCEHIWRPDIDLGSHPSHFLSQGLSLGPGACPLEQAGKAASSGSLLSPPPHTGITRAHRYPWLSHHDHRGTGEQTGPSPPHSLLYFVSSGTEQIKG